MIDGQMMAFRGTLVLCSADNPAACLIGGYKCLHSAFRKCRTCMVVDSDMQTKVLLWLKDVATAISKTNLFVFFCSLLKVTFSLELVPLINLMSVI